MKALRARLLTPSRNTKPLRERNYPKQRRIASLCQQKFNGYGRFEAKYGTTPSLSGGTQGKSDPTSQAKFHHCWNDFSSQNEQLHRSLPELKNNMNLADPVWCSEPEHMDDLKDIDALYWQKVALQEDAVTFYDISQSGLIFRKISIDTEKSGALAKAFEASANQLDSAAKALGNALKPT